MKMTILAVGRCREKFWTMAIEEYRKRLSSYVDLEIIEVPDEKVPEDASEKEKQQIRGKEGDRLLRYIRPDAFVAALAIEGESLDSVAFSCRIENLAVHGVSRMVFVIGGSIRLSDAVLRRADWKVSFSAMTFPHQLMRVILLEQIYRAYRIMRHEPYHK